MRCTRLLRMWQSDDLGFVTHATDPARSGPDIWCAASAGGDGTSLVDPLSCPVVRLVLAHEYQRTRSCADVCCYLLA